MSNQSMPTPELISEKPPGVFYFDDGLYLGFCDASPEGVFDGDQGSVMVRRDAKAIYQKGSARGTLTGWVVVTDATAIAALLNATVGAIPYKSATSQLSDSPLFVSAGEVYAGNGVTNAAPAAGVVNGTGGSGSNIAGGDVTIVPGKGTGNAAPGIIQAAFPLVGASGAVLQSLSARRPRPWWNLITDYSHQVTVANTAAETALIAATPDQGSCDIEAGFFRVGMKFRFRAHGTMNNTGTPTIRFRFYLGPTANVLVLDSQALTMIGITGGGCNWEYEGDFVITGLGTSGGGGVVRGQRDRWYYNTSNAGTQNSASFVPSNVNIDTTGVNRANLTVQWGTANASNTITLENYELDFKQ